MPTYSEIDITFDTDFEEGDIITLVMNDNGVFDYYETTWVTTRSGAGEVTTGTPTGTPGERTAINYEAAFDLDYTTLFITTQSTNEVNIQSETEGLLFVGIIEDINNAGTFSATYTNYYAPPDISTIDFALTRSPHYVNIPFTFDTTTKATISLYVWDGDITVLPSEATYTLTLVRPTTDFSEFNTNLSDLIREKINAVPVIDLASTTQVIDSTDNSVKWIQYNVVYTDPVNTIADIEGTFVAIDGYGNYAEGVNPNKPTNNVLTDVAYRKVERSGFILFPFVNNGTITSIDIDSDGGEINETETITDTNESTDVVQYICVDVSQAATDEYITITTKPADDEFVYEIVDECRFDPKQVIFKNNNGVFECLTLFKKSNQTLTVKDDKFVNNYISGGTYDTTKHQFQKINIQSKKKIRLNSGYITESENPLYEQLLQSDKVYFYENDALVPINVDKNSLDLKTRVNDKLVDYSMEFEYAYNQIQNV